MHGKLVQQGNSWIWHGRWAYDEFSINDPRWGSQKFTLRCEGGSRSGTYSGHFMLDPGVGELESIPESAQVQLEATESSEHVKLNGTGSNSYGEFEFRCGVLDETTGDLCATKQYVRMIDDVNAIKDQDREIRSRLKALLGSFGVPVRDQISCEGAPPADPVVTSEHRKEAAGLLQHTVPAFRPLPYVDNPHDIKALLQTQHPTDQELLCWSFNYSEELFCAMAVEGMLPFSDCPAELVYTMLGKFAPQRCVLEFSNARISRKARKQASQYQMTLNHAFEKVMAGCSARPESWLHPPIQALFRVLHSRRKEPNQKVQLWSVELWEKEGQKRLVAGELGIAYGTMYTSLSGFHVEGTSRAGTIQILSLAAVLQKCGFQRIDFDEPQPYMASLGATTISSLQFLGLARSSRETSLPCAPQHCGCAAELITALAKPAPTEQSIDPASSTSKPTECGPNPDSQTQQKRLLKRLQKSNGICVDPLNPGVELKDADVHATFSTYGDIVRAFYVPQVRRAFVVFAHSASVHRCLHELNGTKCLVANVEVSVRACGGTDRDASNLTRTLTGAKRKWSSI